MWCLATKLYVVFVVIKIILIVLLHPHLPELSDGLKYQYINLYIGVLITWFLLLAWLCSSCNQNMALFTLLLPFIICSGFMLTILILLIRIHRQVIT